MASKIAYLTVSHLDKLVTHYINKSRHDICILQANKSWRRGQSGNKARLLLCLAKSGL